jgi:hypothetical protein
MSCDEFQSIVGDLARDQMMAATVCTQALAHGASCDDCALRLADERSLTLNLRALANQMKALEAGPEAEARILAAFRNRVEIVPVVVHSRRWYWVGAAAAAVLLVFGMVAIRGRVAPAAPPEKTEAKVVGSPKTPPPNEERFFPSSVPRNQSIQVAAEPRPRRSIALPRPSSDRAGRPAVPTLVANSTNNEIATDFFPVGDGSASNLQDGGQLMRVELPRSTMARFGLPVNTARANERVKADVLVSADGLARAIRFVQ